MHVVVERDGSRTRVVDRPRDDGEGTVTECGCVVDIQLTRAERRRAVVGVRSTERKRPTARLRERASATDDAAERRARVVTTGGERIGPERNIARSSDRADRFVCGKGEDSSATDRDRTCIGNRAPTANCERSAVNLCSAVVGVRSRENHCATPVLSEAKGRSRNITPDREVTVGDIDVAGRVHGHRSRSHIQVVRACEREVAIPVLHVVVEQDGSHTRVVDRSRDDGECTVTECGCVVDTQLTRAERRRAVVGVRSAERKRPNARFRQRSSAADDAAEHLVRAAGIDEVARVADVARVTPRVELGSAPDHKRATIDIRVSGVGIHADECECIAAILR